MGKVGSGEWLPETCPKGSCVRSRVKLWLEQDGKLVMSDYRLRLLRLVMETGSLAESASRLGLSYRRAWGKIKELEANLGVPLLQSAAGGARGGGSTVTPQGRDLLERYAAFQSRAEAAVETIYRESFGEGLHAPASRPAASHKGSAPEPGCWPDQDEHPPT